MLSNPGVKNGILMGVASIAYSLICYFINPKMMLNGWAFLGYIIIIFFMYRGPVEARKNGNGILKFGEALKISFLVYVLGTLISSIFVFLMFNYIDTSLNEVLREIQIEQTEFMVKLMGGEDQLDLIQDQIEQQDMQMTPSVMVLGYLVNLIFPGFVMALIIAAITKKTGSGSFEALDD